MVFRCHIIPVAIHSFPVCSLLTAVRLTRCRFLDLTRFLIRSGHVVNRSFFIVSVSKWKWTCRWDSCILPDQSQFLWICYLDLQVWSYTCKVQSSIDIVNLGMNCQALKVKIYKDCISYNLLYLVCRVIDRYGRWLSIEELATSPDRNKWAIGRWNG